jgi:glycosyltransferase involved in cell wall biosynthesis
MGNEPPHDGPIQASVVIPAYNAERTIRRAIASAFSQTEQRFEIVVIDDASSDVTAAIVVNLADQDKRINLLRNTTNLGPARIAQPRTRRGAR